MILESILLLMAVSPQHAAAGWVQMFDDGMLSATTFSPATIQNVRLTMEFRCALRCGVLGVRSFPNQGFVVDLGESKLGEWHRLEVLARGSSLVAKVDGKVTQTAREFRYRAGGIVLLPGVGGMEVRDARWKPLDMAAWEPGRAFDDFVLQVDVKGGPAGLIVRADRDIPESGYRIPIGAGDAEWVTYTVTVSSRHVQVWAGGIPVAMHNPEPKALRLRRGTIIFQKDALAGSFEFRNALLAQLPVRGDR